MKRKIYCTYLSCEGADLFTVVSLPDGAGKFPTVILRNPYVEGEREIPEDELLRKKLESYATWLDNGYAVVSQHCRGTGKSTGDCIPYIYEREDGLNLQEWIREQAFYNGELYLFGASYTSSVHFVTAPFKEDVKAAVFKVQDSERYNLNYRNGFYKMGLHGGWFVKMYKKNSNIKKSFTADSYHTLPLLDFSRTVFGEEVPSFDEILKHPDRNDDFWNTRYGGGEAQGAVREANIPVLLVTGFYDIYTGGVFDMWKSMDENTRKKSALAVHPYDHGGKGATQPVSFPGGDLDESFPDYAVRWFDAARGKCDTPFKTGEVTYYKLFGVGWCTDSFAESGERVKFSLGNGSVSYKYNPYAPASFKGGLSTNFGGCAWQDAPNSRYDIVNLYTPEFDCDTFIKGSIKAKLRVSSDCLDTCFYLRLSLVKEEGDYGLRDDINKISSFAPDYKPGEEVDMSFSFDEHAFVVKKGERIRIDISSSAFPHYVPHTNQRGLFSEQTVGKIANNTVHLDDSYIELPIEI